MSIEDTLSLAAKALKMEGIQFALIGGFALAAHGVVRATQDIDLLVEGQKRDQAKNSLTKHGFKIVFENAEVMHLSGPGQLDLLMANRPPTMSMITRARMINDFPVPVLCAEDIIGLKIQAYKNDSKREFQDKADIQALMETVADLDFKLIKDYADMFDEWKFISELRQRL